MNILVVHKAASTLLQNIARYINTSYGEHKINLIRIQNERILTYDGYSKQPYLIIIRHPLNKLISEYYSFGWTHDIVTDFQVRLRAKIKTMKLEEFVIFHQKSVYCYEKIYRHGSNIIKYENMMDNPKSFFRLMLKLANLDDALDDIYNQFKCEFEYISDKSDDIIKGNYKNHRRILDHTEYLNKLPKAINEKLETRTIEIIKNYDNCKCMLGDK